MSRCIGKVYTFLTTNGEPANLGAVHDLDNPYTFSGLAAGDYVIALKLANSDHTFIGIEDSVEITVE